MDESILVSIIVPVYNVERYVSKCLDSIIEQTYKNIEIIIVNDGSTDNSGAICNDYKIKDYRVKYIEKSNEGVSKARNDALEIASGEYITFVDADDYIDSNCISKIVDTLRDTKSDIVICGHYDVNENYDIIKESPAYDFQTFNGETAIKELCMEKLFKCVIWSKFYKRDLFINNKFNEDTKIAEDLELLYKILPKTEKVTCIPDRLYYWLSRNDSVTKEKYNNDWKKEIEISDKVVKFCMDKYPQNTDYAIRRYIRVNLDLMWKVVVSNSGRKEYIQLAHNLKKYKLKNKKVLSCKENIKYRLSKEIPVIMFILQKIKRKYKK